MQIKFFIKIFFICLIFCSCTKTKDDNTKLNQPETKSKENISSAGVKEGDVEFKVEYINPRKIYKIEKEDLNNDGNKEIIVFSVVKDTSEKYNNYYNFDMLEIFALNSEGKSYIKILSDTVDYSDKYFFEDLDGQKKKQIIIYTNTGGNDPIVSMGMFIYDMVSNDKIDLVSHIDAGSPGVEDLRNTGRKQIIVNDRFWGVMPMPESILFVSAIYDFDGNKLVEKNSEYGEFFDDKIKEAKEKYYGVKRKVEMGMQPMDMAYPLYKEAAEVIINYYSKDDLKGLKNFWDEEKDSLRKNIPEDEFLDLNNFILKALPSAKNA